MKPVGLVLVTAAMLLATGCQRAQERYATRATVERVEEASDQYLITAQVDRLDARGRPAKTIARPRIVCAADQEAHVRIGQDAADGSMVDGLTIDVLVPSDAVPQVARMTTTVRRQGVVVNQYEIDVPVPARATEGGEQ